MSVTVNGERIGIAPGTTVAALVTRLGARPTGTAVALNGDVVPRSAWTTSKIADGDYIEVLAAVQGG